LSYVPVTNIKWIKLIYIINLISYNVFKWRKPGENPVTPGEDSIPSSATATTPSSRTKPISKKFIIMIIELYFGNSTVPATIDGITGTTIPATSLSILMILFQK